MSVKESNGWKTQDGITFLESGPFLLLPKNKLVSQSPDNGPSAHNAADIRAETQKHLENFIENKLSAEDKKGFKAFLAAGTRKIAIPLENYQIGKNEEKLIKEGLTGLLEDFKKKKGNAIINTIIGKGHATKYLQKKEKDQDNVRNP